MMPAVMPKHASFTSNVLTFAGNSKADLMKSEADLDWSTLLSVPTINKPTFLRSI